MNNFINNKKSAKELVELYKSDYSEIELHGMSMKFASTYGITPDTFDKSRFIKFTQDELDTYDQLAQGRFGNNRSVGTSQVSTGCGDAVSYLERDYPGVIGEKAFEKYISSLSLQNLTDINSIECVSKKTGSDKGDFIVKVKDDFLKLEIKCNMFDKNHKKQNSLNVQMDQIETLRKNKPDFFVQVIMVNPTLAYIAGYADWFDVINNTRNPVGRKAYHAVPFSKIKFFNLDNMPEID